MAASVGASAAGARAFTATSSQGLALMHEMLHWAAAGRLPIVMADVNRALGPGWNIWMDQSDSLAQRDTGWIQLYCETNQEVLDTTIMAFRLAEQVDRFLPPRRARYKLDVQDPHSFGALVKPEDYTEMRWHLQDAMRQAPIKWADIEREYATLFGRSYGAIETYRTEQADLVLVTSGTITSTARHVVDLHRDHGDRIGLIKVKMFRPFPTDALRAALAGVDRVAVLDRNFSPGHGGIFAAELRSALYDVPAEDRPAIYGYVLGLGGRDVTPAILDGIIDHVRMPGIPERADIWVGVKV